jgi:WD40 repeat protein
LVCAVATAQERIDPVIISGPEMEQGVKTRQPIRAIAFSPDGKVLVSGSNGQRALSFWDAEQCKLIAAAEMPGELVRAVFFTDGGKRIVAVGDEVAIFDAVSHALLSHWPIKDGWAGAALSPDGGTLALSGIDPVGDPPKGLIRLFDLNTGEVRRRISAHLANIRWLAWSSDGALLASLAEQSFTESGDDVIVWNAATAQEVARFARSPNSPPRGIAFLPSGTSAANIKWPFTHFLRDGVGLLQGATSVAERAQPPRALVRADYGPALTDLHGEPPFALLTPAGNSPSASAISPDGTTIAGGDSTGDLFIWTTDRGRAEAAGPLPMVRCQLICPRTEFLQGEPIEWSCRLTNISDHLVPIYADRFAPQRSALSLNLMDLNRARPLRPPVQPPDLQPPRQLFPGQSIEVRFAPIGTDAMSAGNGNVYTLPPQTSRDVALVRYAPPPDAAPDAGGTVLSQPMLLLRDPGPAFSHPVISEWAHSADGVLSARIDSESALYGKPSDVFVHGEIRNDSNHDVTFSVPQPDFYASLQITGPHGPLPTPTARLRLPPSVTIKPGKITSFYGPIDANRFPGFFEAGEYSVGFEFVSHTGSPNPPAGFWTGSLSIPPIKITRVIRLIDAPAATTQPVATPPATLPAR